MFSEKKERGSTSKFFTGSVLFIPKGAVKIIQKRLKFPKIFAERILGQSGWGTNPSMYTSPVNTYVPRLLQQRQCMAGILKEVSDRVFLFALLII